MYVYVAANIALLECRPAYVGVIESHSVHNGFLQLCHYMYMYVYMHVL